MPKFKFLCQLAFVLCGGLTLSAVSFAELPTIRFDRIEPLGTSAVSTVEVQILGNDIENAQTLLFDQPGFQVEFVKEKTFKVTVAADVPQGTYDVYLVGRFGVSNPRLFAVTKGLTEVTDNGANRSLTQAQLVEVNTAINGTMDGSAEDFYKFLGHTGQRVTIDFQAARLISDLDGTMSLLAQEGRQLASSGDVYGRDPFIDFLVPADGEYIVAVHDLSYRGGSPYRLVISDRPHVENIFPAVMQVGQQATLTALGRNLGAGSQPSPLSMNDLPLEQLAFTATPANDILPLRLYRFRSHPTHHSVLPTAATCTLTGEQILPNSLDGTWNGQPMLITEHPVKLEQEPNDTRGQAQQVTLPAIVSGRFDKPRDADWYEFETDADGAYYFDVYCERIAGRADPYLVVMDDKENRLQELDDYGHRVTAFDGHLRDPSGTVNLSKNRKYRVLVQDRYRRGGAQYHYVLEMRKPKPDFFVASVHSRNDQMGTTLFRGSSAWLDLVIHQTDGYTDPVLVSAENLPAGVHFQPTSVFQNNRGTFVLWADDNAPEFTGPIRLIAEGKRGDETLRREVRPYSRTFNNAGSLIHRNQMIAVREQGPFAVWIEPERLEIEEGQTASVKVRVNRLSPDFKDKVSLQPNGWSGNFQLGNFDIPGDQTERTVEIKVQPGTRPGDYTLCLIGQGQVPFNKDPQATMKPNTLVTVPSRPVTITVKAKPK